MDTDRSALIETLADVRRRIKQASSRRLNEKNVGAWEFPWDPEDHVAFRVQQVALLEDVLRLALSRRFVAASAYFMVLWFLGCAPSESVDRNVVDKAKFARVWESFKSIEGATTVGVSYVQFGPLLQEFATAVLLVPTVNRSPEEAQIVSVLADMRQAYQDSMSVWRLTFDDSNHNDDYVQIITSEGQHTIDRAEVISTLYDLTVVTLADGAVLLPRSSVQELWAWAALRGSILASDLAP